jgi:DNA-binding NtrC family response regulator
MAAIRTVPWTASRVIAGSPTGAAMQRAISMLIADDSHAIVQLLTDAARTSKLPLRLSTTDNGRDCLTLLNGSNIDLAFIDVHMPELSGTEAFWSARKLGNQTFVTLMSNPPAAEAVEMAIKLRAYEFLFKPFTMSDVVSIIQTYARISSPTKVLIVDDSATVRQLVQKVVRGSIFKCDISEAGDGETALALARKAPFDAVFLDYNMPGMNGPEVMRDLRLIQPSTRVVMISAEHSAAREREALASGACAFLQKPFDSREVDRVLHAAFGLRSPTLKVESSQPNFDVAIQGSTVRVAHKISGHIFEYLWSARPPHLRNRIVRPAQSYDIAPIHVAPVAEEAALVQLRSARLLAA